MESLTIKIYILRTSPEEFLNRLADVEKSKGGGSGKAEKGKEFSFPTKPKRGKSDFSQTEEKVTLKTLYTIPNSTKVLCLQFGLCLLQICLLSMVMMGRHCFPFFSASFAS
jgi:hypothetical protein